VTDARPLREFEGENEKPAGAARGGAGEEQDIRALGVLVDGALDHGATVSGSRAIATTVAPLRGDQAGCRTARLATSSPASSPLPCVPNMPSTPGRKHVHRVCLPTRT
jgi:hypothetical protein